MKQLLFILLLPITLFSQNKYPQDYFRSPMDIPIILSGTFGELRSNHFHSGIDIKTKQTEGLNIYTAAEGYVSRIKISRFGYGKAIYITHPNGYTSVYGHLKRFSDKIETYVKKMQYQKESFAIELFPSNKELQINANEIIAYSGNTGGSGGPHLHFEIRDKQSRPINPMLFGITAKDKKPPAVTNIFVYPKDKDAIINGKNERVELRLIPKKNGVFEVEKINAYGNIGFGITTYDQLDLAANKNGVNNITTFFNGNKALEFQFSKFSFSESKHINRLIDYSFYRKKRKRIIKLFVEKNNPLSIIKFENDKGYINIKDSTSSVFKIDIKDFAKNKTSITIPIKGKYELLTNTYSTKEVSEDLSLIKEASPTELAEGRIQVYVPSKSIYEDVSIDFNVNSDTLKLGKDTIPIKKNYTITYDVSGYKNEDLKQMFIARLYGYYKKPSYVSTKRKNNTLVAKTKKFGTYTLAQDSIPPKISPINFKNKKWMSNYRYLKIMIDDDLSGINKYRATVNGKWILMEYDYKTKTLTHDFNDGLFTETKNELKVIVLDNVGNSSKFEATIFRK